MERQPHWESVYAGKAPNEVSWYRRHLEQSLSLLRSCALPADARIVDVGGGASTFVDDLLEEGFSNLAVIDLAESALRISRERLGERARSAVDWIVGDATRPLLPDASVDFWHDRAVFHFLTDDQARQDYVQQATRCIKPGGHVLVATFALDGPEKCSGLPVQRYDAEGIAAALGDAFEMQSQAAERHRTPAGKDQSFAYCLCRRRQ